MGTTCRTFAACFIVGALLSPVSLDAQVCEQELAPSVFSGGHRFGESIDISGDVAVLSDRLAGVGGEATVFRFDGTDWIEEQTLAPPSSVPGEEFGWSVAIDGDVIAVGSRFSTSAGGCSVFRYDGIGWNFEQFLAPPSGRLDGEFGRSVAVSADRVLVGASESGADGDGLAYLYLYDAGTWQLESTIEPVTDWSHEFGYSVDIEMSSDLTTGTIVVGEPLGAPVGFSPGGSATVYELSGGVWSFAERVLPPISAFDGRFGESVSLSGDTFVAGAYRDDEGATNVGSAYVYRRDLSGWFLEQKIIHTGSGDQVGRRVAISGEIVVLSARRSFSPRSVVYTRDQGVWTHAQDLINEQSGRYFGQEVAIDGERVILGQRNVGSGPNPRGARVYTRSAGEWNMFGFFEHPQDAEACLGDSFEFSAIATGAAPLTYQWQRDGIDLPGETSPTFARDSLSALELGVYTVVITSQCGTMTSLPAETRCSEFLRGDSNGDGTVDGIGDGIAILTGLFGGGPFHCEAAADSDGNGGVNVADAVYILSYGFAGGPPPPAPFPGCGYGGAPGFLSCQESSCH